MINRMRSLSASEDEQGWSGIAFSANFEELLANRNARDLAVSKVPAGLLEVHGGGRDHGRNQTISKTGHHVGFEGDRRNTAQASSQHGRAGRIASHADHH